MKTGNMAIHLTSDGHLFDVQKGIQATTALDLAADLSEGIQLLTERMYNDINEDGDLGYTCEMRAIGLLSEVASALVRSVNWSVKQEQNNDK